jgi:hypothetical protein
MKLRRQTIRHNVVTAIQVAGRQAGRLLCARANCRPPRLVLSRKSEGKGGTQAEGV